MPGRFRNVKWAAAAVWLVFFVGPYLRWGERQAVLFDIPGRQFHIFGITILPQDVWMLSLTLLFFAILLAVVTSIAGRVFCGYFCFQTVWTDIFTWIEDKLEGGPQKRRKLDEAPWDFTKIRIKVVKHVIWIAIGMLTGISFTLWFGDAFEMWKGFLTLSASSVAWGSVAVFTFFTYLFAGHMREQVCFWLCPYARIQGVMYDKETILPAYDYNRGEPRGKLKKGQIEEGKGDCIECGQCVAVCPTGIDIRHGQQEGCITCALCLDACDAVMEKIGRPTGLIRYASMDELEGKPALKMFQRPRVLVYLTILTLAMSGILYGLFNLSGIEVKVLHERQPLYVLQSDGSIQNKYSVKILNKTAQDQQVRLSVAGLPELTVSGGEGSLAAHKGRITSYTVFVRVPRASLKTESTPITFHVEAEGEEELVSTYTSMFIGPRP
ncbi:MAG: cytochrome c oxidase accessory protein CcoG [Gammaproteobacteria bacterium HGW-Gammaproteobacteria-1]|nr:MAG: cytochrome c oxidase accessory protein CcoG [Gammaproteobacteria bacterium HGW-Gammaproteobacteria-1]